MEVLFRILKHLAHTNENRLRLLFEINMCKMAWHPCRLIWYIYGDQKWFIGFSIYWPNERVWWKKTTLYSFCWSPFYPFTVQKNRNDSGLILCMHVFVWTSVNCVYFTDRLFIAHNIFYTFNLYWGLKLLFSFIFELKVHIYQDLYYWKMFESLLFIIQRKWE